MSECLAVFGILGIAVFIFCLGNSWGYNQAEIDHIRYPRHFHQFALDDKRNVGVVQLEAE